nr:organic cation transporter protein-like isoform X1 [Biomphalaria glabrata]
MQAVITVYTLGTPKHRCAILGDPNDTYDRTDLGLFNDSIPPDVGDCYLYDRNTSTGNKTLKTCERWVYDKTNFDETLVTKFNFVCKDEMKKSLAQMFYMLGSFLGTFIFGPLGDVIGRRLIMITSGLIYGVASTCVAFSMSLTFLCIISLVNGSACTAYYNVLYVLGLELVGQNNRILAGTVIVSFFGIGIILLPVMAYFLRDWKTLQLAASAWVIVFVLYYWCVPESPRWLISKKRFTEADAILQHAAKVNKRSMTGRKEWAEIAQVNEPFWKIATHRILVIRTTIIYFNWAVCSMSYYGMSLSVGSLSGSIFLNAVLYGLVELLSYIISYFLLDRIGRRRLHIGFMVITGLSCSVSSLPTLYGGYSWLTIILATIGKFGVSGAYANIWLYSAELFPTVLRSSGLSSGSFFARIGGLISPFIANIGTGRGGNLEKLIPLFIFGALSLVAGFSAYFLPETKNRRLPETIEDAVAFGRSNVLLNTMDTVETG